MASIADLLNSESSDSPLLEAIIAEDGSAPDEPIEVIIPSFSPTIPWGPCPWTPRGETSPSKGDRALVALAATDEPGVFNVWIVAWWPYD